MSSTFILAPVEARAPRPSARTVGPPDDSDTNATRHLSAGSYLDDEFCLSALREVYCKPKRIAAPAYGFDPMTVLGHCLRARRALVIRDSSLIALLLFASWLSILSVLVVLATLLGAHLLATSVRVGRDSVRYLRDSIQIRDTGDADEDTTARGGRQGTGRRVHHRPRRLRGFRRLWLENVFAQVFGRVIGTFLTYLCFAAVALAVAAASRTIWRSDPLGGVGFRLAAPAITTGLAIGAFAIPTLARLWSQRQLRRLTPDRPVTPPLRTPRLAEIEDQTGGNTVVYSGYQPFVGSGISLREWSFAQRLVKPPPARIPGRSSRPVTEAEREFDEPPFTTLDICAHVRDYIDGLAKDPCPERRLPALTVSDRIFVAGTEIDDFRPYTSLDDMVEIIRNPTAPQRHYLVFQVVSWRGELVTTVYVHFAVQGKALYAELHVTGLLPCDERFRIVDQVDGTGPKAALRDAGRGLRAAPTVVAAAPTALTRIVGDLLKVGLRHRAGKLKVRKGYDYGAVIGLRELGASVVVRDHMQTQDIVKYGRIIERRVLAAILDFLESKEVDVTEYRQRSLTILNAGAVATDGGTVNVSGDAIGVQNFEGEGAD